MGNHFVWVPEEGKKMNQRGRLILPSTGYRKSMSEVKLGQPLGELVMQRTPMHRAGDCLSIKRERIWVRDVVTRITPTSSVKFYKVKAGRKTYTILDIDKVNI